MQAVINIQVCITTTRVRKGQAANDFLQFQTSNHKATAQKFLWNTYPYFLFETLQAVFYFFKDWFLMQIKL